MGRKPTSNAWQWSRSARTRRVLLEAAREVFAGHGYDGASIADVVERAGSSVGSLYHHFGGKAELFVALWQDHQDAQEQRVVTAVAKARADGEEDLLTPVHLRRAGVFRRFLGAPRRGPPVHDGRWAAGVRDDEAGPQPRMGPAERGAARAGADPVDRMTVSVLTTIMGGTAREIAASSSGHQAGVLADAAITLIRRLDPLNPPAPSSRPSPPSVLRRSVRQIWLPLHRAGGCLRVRSRGQCGPLLAAGQLRRLMRHGCRSGVRPEH